MMQKTSRQSGAIGLVAAVWLLFGAAAADSADSGGGVVYVPLQPAFVTNFGEGVDGRLSFVKADVSVRVSSDDAATATQYHLPALRNSLILLLSRQNESTVSTGAGRESIRAEALAELRAILEQEEGEPFIEDVLFTNFIVQR